MARPPSTPAPAYSLNNAVAAAKAVRALRAEARDPDLDFFPPTVQDDMDIDDVVNFLASHRKITPDVRAAELPYRAKLLEYQHQRDTKRYKRQVLELLETARHVNAPSMTFGPLMGLPTRSAVSNRKTRLTVELKLGGQAPPTRRELDKESQVDQWLTTNRLELIHVGEILADHRDDLVDLLVDTEQRQQLQEAIDQTGEQLSARPRRGFAGAISYAMFLLRPNGPAADAEDPRLRDVIKRGTRLRIAFNQLNTAGSS